MQPGADRRHRRSLCVPVLVAALAAAACTGDPDEPADSVATTTTEAPVPRVDDGVLRLAALIPANDSSVGAILTDAVEGAVDTINAAGGVLGRDVVLAFGDEGTTAAAAAQEIENLVAGGADAIIGPTSSNTAIRALDEAVAAGIVSCSATASAISLDGFPDDGLFFRTIPSDSLQATAIAQFAGDTGANRIAIVHIDDAFGRPFADEVEDALGAQPSIDVVDIPIDVGDDDLADDMDELASENADAAIVLGSGDDLALFLEAMAGNGDIELDNIFVNDAARAASSRPAIAALPPQFRNKIVGVTPQITLPETVGDVDDTPFATQVADCVTLLALAAVQGNSDAPRVIASQMSSVSSGGTRCRTFADCVAILEADGEINYDVPTRITDLARDGDPSRAFFDQFTFDSDGGDVLLRNVAVTR